MIAAKTDLAHLNVYIYSLPTRDIYALISHLSFMEMKSFDETKRCGEWRAKRSETADLESDLVELISRNFY